MTFIRWFLISLLIAVAPAALTAEPRFEISAPTHISEPFQSCCPPQVLIWGGSSFVVFWTSDGKAMARRVGLAAETVSAATLIEADRIALAAASDGSSVLLLLGRTEGFDAFTDTQIVGPGLQPLGGVADSMPGTARAVLFDGAGYIVASVRRHDETNRVDLWISRLSRDGRVVMSKRVDVVPGVHATGVLSLATNGVETVLAWVDAASPGNCGTAPCGAPTNTRVISFDSELRLTGMRGEAPGKSASFPTVVWTGSHFILISTDLERVYAQRLSPGVPPANVDREVVLAPPPMTVLLDTAAVWDGRHIIVVTKSAFPTTTLLGVRLNASGLVVDSLDGMTLDRPVRFITAVGLASSPGGATLLGYVAGGSLEGYAVSIARVLSGEGATRKTRAVRR